MGQTKQFVERNLELWNAHDRAGWTGDVSDDAEIVAPGGMQGSGRDLRDLFYAIWQDGFPDNKIRSAPIFEDGETGVLEGIFEGTHTGTMKVPGNEVPPTNKRVSVRFVTMYRINGGKAKSLRVYFDQVELLIQLGLMPTPSG
jgi:ketosteroid isomerase-like protein